MAYDRPYVLSIAGLDPSGGAGLLADIKTFEQHRCIGFGIASALTAQTEEQCLEVRWLPAATIQMQCRPLLERYSITIVKIGIVQDLPLLLELLRWLHNHDDNIRIVWDPVLSASSGLQLLEHTAKEILPDILKHITLLTPNAQEVLRLAGGNTAAEAASRLAQYCPVLLKGGHAQEKGVDYLYERGNRFAIMPKLQELPAKHGSGCILSSAIAAQLALGLPLLQSCQAAKAYIETILNSNPFLLAYHYV